MHKLMQLAKIKKLTVAKRSRTFEFFLKEIQKSFKIEIKHKINVKKFIRQNKLFFLLFPIKSVKLTLLHRSLRINTFNLFFAFHITENKQKM